MASSTNKSYTNNFRIEKHAQLACGFAQVSNELNVRALEEVRMLTKCLR